MKFKKFQILHDLRHKFVGSISGCWGFTTVLISKMMTVGVGHSRRYCNTGYNQSQGRRPSTLKCIGSISQRRYRANHPSEINPNSDSRSRSDGRPRRYVQYRVDQSLEQRPRSLLYLSRLYLWVQDFNGDQSRCLKGVAKMKVKFKKIPDITRGHRSAVVLVKFNSPDGSGRQFAHSATFDRYHT